VEQVSRPALIALIATFAFAGAWFTVLRPKTDSAAAPAPVATAPGQAGLGKAVAKAKGAVAASNAAVKRSEQAAATAGSGGTAATTAKPGTATANPTAKAKPATPAKPAKPALPALQAGDRSAPILRQLADGKVVVAIFFNKAGADDRAALRAVRATNRHGGRVATHVIPIAKVGAYNALTTGVQVLQAPTILVIGPDHKARTIVGYTEVKEIDQTVGDVGGRGFQERKAFHLTGWANRASEICKDNGFGVATDVEPPNDLPGLKRMFAGIVRIETSNRRRTAAVKAVGAKQQAAKRALLKAYDEDLAAFAGARNKLNAGASPTVVVLEVIAAERRLVTRYRPALHAVRERHCLG
jgi:hypothetical protein